MTEDLQQEVARIKERNSRVEADKAWETSLTRIASLMIITYVIATLVLVLIENEHPFRNALVPTVGFFLSIQSLPFLKKMWIKRYLEKGR